MIQGLKEYIEEYNLNKNKEIFIQNLKKITLKIPKLEFKAVRNLKDPILTSFIKELNLLPKINEEILYDENFVKEFYKIFWSIISKLAIGTENFYDFVSLILNELNRITVPDYIIYDCRSTDNYNCGRAMMEINLFPSKFLLFNTDEKALMDVNTQIFYSNYKENLKKECSKSENKNENKINSEEIDENFIKKNYSQYANRILKEILLLKKNFNVSMEKNNNLVKLVIQNDKNQIILTLPSNYPSESPFGIFNGRTISDVDLDWSLSKNLKDLTDNLIKKKLPFSRTLSKSSLEKLCSFVINI